MTAHPKHCTGLTELRLREVQKLDSEFVDIMKKMTGLTYLDLGYPESSLSEEALIELMAGVRQGLTHLDLSGHALVTDMFLMDGIKAQAQVFTGLTLANVPLLVDKGVAEFFDT
jgi:DNA repair protein RAD7